MALKFYTSVVNGLKLKIRKLGLTLTFVEVTGEKLVWVGPLLSPPPQISNRLDRAKTAVLKFVDLVSENILSGGLQFQLRWRTCAFIITKSGHYHGCFPSFFSLRFQCKQWQIFPHTTTSVKITENNQEIRKIKTKIWKVSVYHLYFKNRLFRRQL